MDNSKKQANKVAYRAWLVDHRTSSTTLFSIAFILTHVFYRLTSEQVNKRERGREGEKGTLRITVHHNGKPQQ